MTLVEALKTGQTIMIDEGPWGRTAYVIHDIEVLHGGWEFVVHYGDESGRFTDTVSFEAGALVDADDAPVNLLTAVQAHRELTAAQAMITDFICGRVYASSSLDSVREGSEHQMEAAQ